MCTGQMEGPERGQIPSLAAMGQPPILRWVLSIIPLVLHNLEAILKFLYVGKFLRDFYFFVQDKSVPDIIGTAIPRLPSTEANKTREAGGKDRIHLKKEDHSGHRKGVKVSDKGTEERRREESRRTVEQPREDRRGTGERRREDSRGTEERQREDSRRTGEQPKEDRKGRKERGREDSRGGEERRREDSRGTEERRKEDSRGAEDWRREDSRGTEERRREDSRGGDDRRGETGYCCRETGSGGGRGQNKGSSMRQGSDMRVTEEEVAERLAARQETRRLEAQERQGAEQRRLLREQAEQRRLGVKELKVREIQILHPSKLTVDICMGLLIHKTSLFLALIYKYLGKSKGGGGREGCCAFLNVEIVQH
jgi:hypothetical protein